MRRRDDSAPAGGASAVALVSAVAVRGWTAPRFYQTAASQGVRGAAAGFYFVLAGVIRGGVLNSVWAQCGSGGAGGGWDIRQVANVDRLFFRAANGAGVTLGSPELTGVNTTLVGKVVAVMGLHTGSALRLYANRVQVGAETAIVGYTPSAVLPNRLCLDSPNIDLLCAFGGLGVPSLANFQAWCDSYKSGRARAFVPMPGVPAEHAWGPLSLPVGAATNISDRIGTDTMLVQSTGLSKVLITAPSFAW